MKINMITYTSTFLKSIWNTSRGNYTSFNLSTVTRSWAIALGIRKQPMVKPLRRFRAGQNLFRKIHVMYLQPTSIVYLEEKPTLAILVRLNIYQKNSN